jgi:Zn-dependent peptidase ImmA (M78 family)/DNA-binding XRE family transcriptional regulator
MNTPMATRIPAFVEPPLLVWARKRAALSQEEVAAKVGIEVEKLDAWEAGREQLSIAQLKKLADLYKRPVSVFFLPEPPADFQALRDLRRLQVLPDRISKSLAYEVRAAHERRLIALELAEDIGDPPEDFGISAKKTDNPEAVALRVRERLGVSVQMQARWNNHDHTFRGWRDAIEAADVLVTVLSGAHHQVPLSEVRGFAIAERPFPMIVVNGQDRGYGRVFTMLHELSHVVLGESVLEDDLEPRDALPTANRSTEVFCNKLAAAILMPRESLLAEQLMVSKRANDVYSDAEISALSTRYGVSREALLVRLSDLGKASPAFVQAKRAELAALYASQQKKEEEEEREDEGGGFAPYQYQVLGHLGRAYSRLVLQAYNARRLTLSTASGYLGAQAKLIPKIERAAYGGASQR